jgi:DNA replication protein DnaC
MISDDDGNEIHGPVPSGEWVREHREKLVADAERREDGDWKGALHDLVKAGEERLGRFRLAICSGGRDELAVMCNGDNESQCEFNRDSDCPKRKLDNAVAVKDRRRRWLKQAGVSERVLKAVFDEPPQQTEAVRLLDNAVNREGTCLVVLQGGVGCGKTCAAALWATKVDAHWVTAKALARMSAYDDEAKNLEKRRHLVIDDLGTEYADAKGFFLSNLDGLIDARYADELPTVITTNVAADEFKARYGARIADRIRGAGAWVEVGGTSLRVRK